MCVYGYLLMFVCLCVHVGTLTSHITPLYKSTTENFSILHSGVTRAFAVRGGPQFVVLLSQCFPPPKKSKNMSGGVQFTPPLFFTRLFRQLVLRPHSISHPRWHGMNRWIIASLILTYTYVSQRACLHIPDRYGSLLHTSFPQTYPRSDSSINI